MSSNAEFEKRSENEFQSCACSNDLNQHHREGESGDPSPGTFQREWLRFLIENIYSSDDSDEELIVKDAIVECAWNSLAGSIRGVGK